MTKVNESSMLEVAEPEYEYFYQDEDGNMIPVFYQYEDTGENQIEYQYIDGFKDGEMLSSNYVIEDFGEHYIYESTSGVNNVQLDQAQEPSILKHDAIGTHIDEVINVVAHGSGEHEETKRRKGPTTMKCEFCGVTVKHPSKIQAHMRKHTHEKPFECEYCGQTFAHRTPWKTHLKRHLGETPFQCSYCTKTFPTSSTCKSHEKRVHQKIQKEQLSSDDVGDVNIASKSVDTIQNSQKDAENSAEKSSNNEKQEYICEACNDLTFPSASIYNEHIKRFHSTSKKFHSCRFDCGKNFSTTSNRNEHEKIVHYKIKRYQCCINDCNKLFTRRLYLSNHFTTCHSDCNETIPDGMKGNRVVGFPWDREGELPEFSDSRHSIFITHSDGTRFLIEIMGPLGETPIRDPTSLEDEYINFYNENNNNEVALEEDSPPMLEPQNEIVIENDQVLEEMFY